MSQRIGPGWISHEVYFHSKGRAVSKQAEWALCSPGIPQTVGQRSKGGEGTQTRPRRIRSDAKLRRNFHYRHRLYIMYICVYSSYWYLSHWKTGVITPLLLIRCACLFVTGTQRWPRSPRSPRSSWPARGERREGKKKTPHDLSDPFSDLSSLTVGERLKLSSKQLIGSL